MATGLAEMADQPITWPGLGRRDLGALRIILASDSQDFAAVTRGRLPSWGAGAAFPGGRTIVLRADAGDVTGTLRHELAHLALHQAVHGARAALVRRGLCHLGGRAMGSVRPARDQHGGRTGRHPRTPAISTANCVPPGSPPTPPMRSPHQPFWNWRAATRAGRSTPLFERLEAGVGFDDAVLATTGLAPDRFDEAWRRSVRTRFGLVAWTLGAGLWIAMAMLLLVGYEARRRRDRPRRIALDEGWNILPEPPEVDLTSGPPPAPTGPPQNCHRKRAARLTIVAPVGSLPPLCHTPESQK